MFINPGYNFTFYSSPSLLIWSFSHQQKEDLYVIISITIYRLYLLKYLCKLGKVREKIYFKCIRYTISKVYLGFGTWKSNLCFLFYLFIWSRFCCKFQLSNATSICTKNKQRQLFLVAAYFAFYKLFLFSRLRPRLHPSPPLSVSIPLADVCVCVCLICVCICCVC